MADKQSTSEKVARNIIKTYGEEKFRYLINQFSLNTPGPEIATEFGVTRQRVNQWKRKLGVEHVTYALAEGAEIVLSEINQATALRSPI